MISFCRKQTIGVLFGMFYMEWLYSSNIPPANLVTPDLTLIHKVVLLLFEVNRKD